MSSYFLAAGLLLLLVVSGGGVSGCCEIVNINIGGGLVRSGKCLETELETEARVTRTDGMGSVPSEKSPAQPGSIGDNSKMVCVFVSGFSLATGLILLGTMMTRSFRRQTHPKSTGDCSPAAVQLSGDGLPPTTPQQASAAAAAEGQDDTCELETSFNNRFPSVRAECGSTISNTTSRRRRHNKPGQQQSEASLRRKAGISCSAPDYETLCRAVGHVMEFAVMPSTSSTSLRRDLRQSSLPSTRNQSEEAITRRAGESRDEQHQQDSIGSSTNGERNSVGRPPGERPLTSTPTNLVPLGSTEYWL